MDWKNFNTHDESPNDAFETMCNLLFNKWVYRKYNTKIMHFMYVNGDGGDGGVEAYCMLENGDYIGVQAKWFIERMNASQFTQIQNSLDTAISIRPSLKKYIVCVPRDFTSKKRVRGGNIAANTEDDLWQDFISKNKDEYPSVDIILWDKTTIQSRLNEAECEGIYKYWFDKSVVLESEIMNSYNKAISGWGQTRYIPDLYTTGYISRQLRKFVGDSNLYQERNSTIVKLDAAISELIESYHDLSKLLSSKEDELDVIITDIKNLEEWKLKISGMITLVYDGVLNIDYFSKKQFRLNYKPQHLKDSIFYFNNHSHYKEFSKYYKIFFDLIAKCKYLFTSKYGNRLIFLGNPGTGKTFSIISEIKQMLDEKVHLPILVRAKEFSSGDTWRTIILKTLDLPDAWTEEAIFVALESAAQRVHRNSSSVSQNIQSNVIICVDGIDESSDWDFWKEKIRETKRFKSKFKNTKFVFLSRPYVFEKTYTSEFFYDIYNIPSYGDTSVDDVFDKYINYYNIKIEGNDWIKYSLKTPLALKLFCDLNKNRTISSMSKSTMTITNLFREKMNALENDFGKSRSNVSIRNVLIRLAEIFSEKKFVEHEYLLKKLKLYQNEYFDEILIYLQQQGFIYSRTIREDEFSEDKLIYSWGMQPAFDYLIARKLHDSLCEGKSIGDFYTIGILQMLSIIFVEEDGQLIIEYKNQFSLSEHGWLDLICYSLANSSADAVKKFDKYVFGLMNKSPEIFRTIVVKIILPVSKINGHPMGGTFLDSFLRSFDKPAIRDIWWSIPGNLHEGIDEKWYCYTDIHLDNIEIEDNSPFNGLPLVFAWRLATVQNDEKSKVRLSLMKWAIKNELEFLNLLKNFADVNDFQIIEELFNIAYGISLSKDVSNEYLSQCCDFLQKTIFSSEGLQHYENVVIRQLGINIIKRAVNKNVVEFNVYKKVLPRYSYEKKNPKIFKEALNSERMGGFFPIHYDLARYVLCDNFDPYFRKNNKKEAYSLEAQAFISKYEDEYNIKIDNIDGLIISLAYQYLLDQGWNREKFLGDKQNKIVGVDQGILSTFRYATHGERSHVMTISEKYTWSAQHKLFAIFSNEMPYKDYDIDEKFLTDYLELLDYENAYQSYANTYLNHEFKPKWRHIDEIAHFEGDELDEDLINQWMVSENNLNFKDWVSNNNGDYLIYTYTDIFNEKQRIRETVWVYLGLVPYKDCKAFISSIDREFANKRGRMDVNDFVSYDDMGMYSTPQEVCSVYQEREVELSITGYDEIQIDKGLCYCRTFNDEKDFILPSRNLRNLLGIVDGNGYSYYDEKGKQICIFTKMGEMYSSQQECLLVDDDLFDQKIDETYMPFWLFRIYKSPSNKGYEIYGKKVHHHVDRTYIVWKEQKQFKYKIIKEPEPNM